MARGKSGYRALWREHKVPDRPMDLEQCTRRRFVDKETYNLIQLCVGTPTTVQSSGLGYDLDWTPDDVGMARFRAVVRKLLIQKDHVTEAELRPLTIEQILSLLEPAVLRWRQVIKDHWREELHEAYDMGLQHGDTWQGLVIAVIRDLEEYSLGCRRGERPSRAPLPLMGDGNAEEGVYRPVDAQDIGFMALVLGWRLEELFGVAGAFIPAEVESLADRDVPEELDLRLALASAYREGYCGTTLDDMKTYWLYLKRLFQREVRPNGRSSEPMDRKTAKKSATRPDKIEWSRVMSKMTIATALGVPSVEKLNLMVKVGTYLLRQAGNRQSWQICLKGIPEERRAKLI